VPLDFFFAPFFLWLWAGWFTLHCLRNREYFIIFSTHIYIGSICSCFACTLNLGLELPILSLMRILFNSIDADMKSEIGSSRGGLRPYPLRFHVKEADADAKLIQHGPLGVAYHLPSQLQGLKHTPRCPVKYSATRL
jgi:hypothetical protein